MSEQKKIYIGMPGGEEVDIINDNITRTCSLEEKNEVLENIVTALQHASVRIQGSDLEVRKELVEVKLKLEEQTAINFINNKSGIGFFDTFVDASAIDPASTSTHDPVNKDVKFIGQQNLKLLQESYDPFSEIEMNLYPKKINKISNDGAVNNTNVIKLDRFDKPLTAGDKLFMKNLINEVTGITNDEIVINNAKQNMPMATFIDLVTSPSIVTASGVTLSLQTTSNFQGKNTFAKDSKGNLYQLWVNTNNQIVCLKSTDNGITWFDMGFPIIAGYNQIAPAIAIDNLDNIHVVWGGLDSINTTNAQIKYSKFNGTSWSAWINISNVSAYTQSLPTIAIDSQSNIHVVWFGGDTLYSGTQIKYSKFNGTSWSAWIDIQPIGNYGQHYPQIAIDSKDGVHVTWFGGDATYGTTSTQIKYSKFNGTSWSAWINIAPVKGYPQLHPMIAIDSKDFMCITWMGSNSNFSLSGMHWSFWNGTSWSGPTYITFTNTTQYHPVVTVSKDDLFYLIWTQSDAKYTTAQVGYTYASVPASTGGLSFYGQFMAMTNVSGNQFYPTVCKGLKDFTVPVVSYQDGYDGGKLKVKGKFYQSYITVDLTTPITATGVPSSWVTEYGKTFAADSRGNWYLLTSILATKQISCYKSSDKGITWTSLNFPTIDGYAQYTPTILIDGNDNLHVIWSGLDVNHSTVYQFKYSKFNGTSWSPWINVSASVYQQGRMYSCLDNLDNIHLIFTSPDVNGGITKLKYLKCTNGIWSSAVNIQPTTDYSQEYPTIAVDSKGIIHVVWSSVDSVSTTAFQIRYSKFNGVSWSTPITLTSNVYSQRNMDIAIDKSDNLHVCWLGYNDGGGSAANIKYIKCTDGVWGTIKEFIPSTLASNRDPKIGIDSNNNAHIVWCASIDTNTSASDILYSKYNGTTWSTTVGLGSAGIAQTFPMICSGISDYIEPLIAWTDYTNSLIKIRGKYLKPPMLTYRRVSETIYNGTAFGNGEELSMDSKGNLYYVGLNTSQQVVCYKSSDNGITWISMNFPTIVGRQQTTPMLAIDSKDCIYVTWAGLDATYNTNMQVKYCKFDGSTWGTIINLTTNNSYPNTPTSIVIDSNDNVYIAFDGTDATYTTVSAKCIRISNTGVVGSIMYIVGNSTTAYVDGNVALCVDTSNNIHAVWACSPVTGTNKSAIRYSKYNGSTWSTPITISELSAAGYHQYAPNIAIDSNNNLHVTWYGYDSVNTNKYQIRYSKYNGTAWSTSVLVQSVSGYDQLMPIIAVDANDNPHIIWVGCDSVFTSKMQVKYTYFNGTSWSSWVNLTNYNSLTLTNVPSICKKYKNFVEPLTTWGFSNFAEFRGKIRISNGYIVSLRDSVSLSDNEESIILDLTPKLNGVELELKSIDSEKFIYSAEGITSHDVTVEVSGKDTLLEAISYAIA